MVAVSLKQSNAVRQIAAMMYTFLPGSGSRAWKGHVSFATVANECGVGEFWQGGSKEPAIVALLEGTLKHKPQRFEPLVIEIVKQGITYRSKKGDPLRRDEVEDLNELFLTLEFKFPDLWDKSFLESLPSPYDDAIEGDQEEQPEAIVGVPAADLATLREAFYALSAQADRAAAGLAFESLLNEVFTKSGLEPRPPFRVTGEQIDGSFMLEFETYLIEAKWTEEATPERDLLVFRGKVEGKSAFTRGVFISVNGYSDQAVEAIVKGKQPTFFLVDGYDLVTVLEGQIDLVTLLQWKLRKLTEEGKVFAPVSTLILETEGEPANG